MALSGWKFGRVEVTSSPKAFVNNEGERRAELSSATWTAVSLGSNILRAETAALAALSLISSVYFTTITSSAF